MNNWIRFSMQNVGVVFLAMIMVLAGGLYAKSHMKMEEMPNIDIPYIQVLVVYPGATPEQALEDVGKSMEQALAGLKEMKNMYLAAGNDYVAATLEFSLDKSMDEAQKDINSALAGVKLPEGAQKPEISVEGPTTAPIYSFGITANTDQATIQQFVRDKIKPLFSSVEGISSVNIQGTSEKKLYIRVDPDKLKEENLTLEQIKQVLMANNIGIPAGQLTVNGKDLNVQVGKKINSLDEAKNIDLILVDQDMSAVSDAFKSVGQGFNSVGSSVGKIGQSVGNLTEGQMLLQAEIQVMQGINGLTALLMADQTTLLSLQQELQQAAGNAEAEAKILLQIQGLQQKIRQENDQLTALQKQLSELQERVEAKGINTAETLKSLAKSVPKATTTGNVSLKPELNIRTLKLGDIADVSYASGRDLILTRLNGKPAVITNIKAQPGTNVVDLVKDINAQLDKAKLPVGYELTKLRDSSVQIKNSVNVMQREAMLGALFAMLITFVFLRNWRSTIVAILSIPLSIFASIMTLYWLDYSLNIVTLAGIAVAVGRVVDDSIVVIENVYRRVRASEHRDGELVLQAAKEVGQAVTSSTITTAAVFAPLMFLPGLVGKFFKPFGITVVVSILFSLIVAISVVPLLSKLFLLNLKHREHRDNALQRNYRKLLNWSLNHRAVVTILALALFAGSLALVPKIPQNFLPAEKTVSYALGVTMPVGTATEKTDKTAMLLEDFLQGNEKVKSYHTNVKGENLEMQIELKDDVTRDESKEFETEIQRVTKGLGEGTTSALTPLSIASGYGGLMLVLNGPDIKALKEAGDIIINNIKDVPGLADVHTNLSAERPQLSIEVNPEAAAKKGLNPAMVAMGVRRMIDGDSVMNVVLNERTTPVNLGLKVDDLNNLDIIRSQTVTNITGEQVKLSDVATVEIKPGPTSIQRLNQQEYVMLSGRFTTDNSSGVLKEVEAKVKELNLPEGVTYYFEGESKAIAEGFRNLGLAMVAAVLLVYMVMLLAFGEMLAPFAILFSLPFLFVGGLAGLYLTRESLGVPALVGFLMLIGIVVTNAIVFMDRVLNNRRLGMETKQALLEAGVTRLRPILMTAVATICALLPLAVSQDGGLISRSLAIVVISGLSTSTLLTLVIVPVAYQVLDSLRRKVLVTQQTEVRDVAK